MASKTMVPGIPVKDLKQAAFKDILTAIRHGRDLKGHVVLGKVCIDSVLEEDFTVTTKLQLLGEDPRLLCNLIVCKSNEPLPNGALVAIKQPSVGKCELGLALIVPCTAAIDLFAPELLEHPKLSEDEAAILRADGNELFKQKSYLLAAQAYARCAYSLKQGQEFVLATSNLAGCFLKLGRNEDAIIACNHVLPVDPHHSKALYRKGVALSRLQEHEQALECFRAALKHGRAGVGIEQAISDCSVLLEQSRTGNYDISGWILSDCEQAPPCSDFVGPVELRMTMDGRGRGLFVTRDVKLGELLLVTNPIVYSTGSFMAFLVDALKNCSTSSRAWKHVEVLPHNHSTAQASILNLDHLGSNTGQYGDLKERPLVTIDISRIEKVLELASFGTIVSLEDEAEFTGIWSLPGLINHSCLPNVSKLNVGKVIFIRAALDLSAGTELVLSYIEPLTSWSDHRKERCYTCWGFYCHCRRCKLEETYHRVLGREITATMVTQFKNSKEMTERQLLLYNQMEAALLKCPELSVEEKDLIRAGAAEAYLVANHERIPQICRVAPGHIKSVAYTARFFTRNETTIELEEALASLFGYGLSRAAANHAYEMLCFNTSLLKLMFNGKDVGIRTFSTGGMLP